MKKNSQSLKLITDFLDPDAINIQALNSASDVLGLPIKAFNFFKENELEALSWGLGVSKIGDFAKLDPKSPLKDLPKEERNQIKKVSTLFEDRIKKATTIALIAERFKPETEPVNIQKIVVVGLDNAGKTAIMSNFGAKLGLTSLASLKPTTEVERREIDSGEIKIVLWDFGGQADYRDKYIAAPKEYFLDADLLIYVIDIQDSVRYDESIEYFENIVNALVELEADPYTLVFIHKFDPDLQDDEEAILNIELLKGLIHSTIDGKFEYEIYLTSIYSMLSNEPQFSRTIKDILTKESTLLTDPTAMKVKEVEELAGKLLEGIIALASTVKLLEDKMAFNSQVVSLLAEKYNLKPFEVAPVFSTKSVRTADEVISNPLLDGATKETKKKIMEDLQEMFAEYKVWKETKRS